MITRENLNLWLLHGLHTLLALALPAILFLVVSGCMKAHEQKEDLGPEVSSDTILDAVDRMQSQATFDNLKVGQYVMYVDTRRIENADNAMVMGAKRIDVIDRVDTADEAHFTLKVANSILLNEGKYESTISEQPLWLTKVSSVANSVSTLGLKSPPRKITVASLAHSRDVTVEEPQKITFHHMRESDGVVPASATLQARSDCAGLKPCEIPAHFLHFDMVIWEDSSKYQKITFDFAYSLKTPFLPLGNNFDQLDGLIVADCRATYVPVQNRTVYVRDCLTLDDFQN